MKNIKCDSGLFGWQANLREVYSCYEDFQYYSDIYNLHARLGYDTPRSCWEDNPVVQGSVNPSDFRKA